MKPLATIALATPHWWEALSAWGTALSAVFAAVSAGAAAHQLRTSRLDAQRRLAFDQIRAVGSRLDAYNELAAKRDEEDLLALHCGRATQLTPSAKAFRALLDELDVTAYGIAQGVIHRATAVGHLKTLLRSDVVSLTFLRGLQSACADPCVYEHLATLLVQVSHERRAAEKASAVALTSSNPVHGSALESAEACGAAAPSAAGEPAASTRADSSSHPPRPVREGGSWIPPAR